VVLLLKRLLLCFTSILLALVLCACDGDSPSPGEPPEAFGPVRIGAMKGPTAIGMVHFIENNGGQAEFEIVTTDEIVPLLVQGSIDMAAIPANLAATLYNNTNGAIRVVAVNTLGLNYIMETGDEIRSVEDLRGKIVVTIGKGTTPEITLRHILAQNGIDPDKDITLEFRSEPAEVVAHLKQNGGIAMLPQPFVTTAMDNVEGLREALDLTAEWDRLGSSGTLVTGVFVARADFLERTPEAVLSGILAMYRDSVEWVRANPAEAAPLVEKAGIAPADIAERAIPKCHITFIEGEEMKQTLKAYLGVLFENAPESVGGALPGDDFYVAP
jgi:NitT/TauT family transport system substrate-binding protein